MDIKDFDRILRAVELVNVSLVGCNCSAPARQFLGNPAVSIQAKAEATYINFPIGTQNMMLVTQLFDVSAKLGDDLVLGINCVFQLDYNTREPITDDFFEIFKSGPLVLQMTPFIREFISNICLRMHIPPIILPMVRLDPDNKRAAATGDAT